MFNHKLIGTSYTATAASLAAAVLGPAAWLVVFPLSLTALSIALVLAATGTGVAWITWKRASHISIPTLGALKAVAMTARCRTGIILGLGIGLVSTLSAADFSSYRGMEFGMTLPLAAKVAGTRPSEAKTIHQRPAVIQELDWRPDSSSLTDPVKSGVLQFFNGELSRITITYDRYKVEALTVDDMIEGISAAYGKALQPDAEVAFPSLYGETLPVLARWEDAAFAYNLVRTGDGSTFAMVLYSKELDDAAQTAILEAVRLDELEAPQRERAEQQARDAADLREQEKKRSVNKSNFKP